MIYCLFFSYHSEILKEKKLLSVYMTIKSEHLEGGPRRISSSRPGLQYREFKANLRVSNKNVDTSTAMLYWDTVCCHLKKLCLEGRWKCL